MESTASHIEAIYTKAKTYTETSIALFKLNAIDKTADVVSSIVTWIALGSIIAVFFLFVNVAISLYIGELLQANYLGFLIVSSFYLVVFILVYIFHARLIGVPVTNIVISKLMRPSKEDLLTSKINKDHEESKL